MNDPGSPDKADASEDKGWPDDPGLVPLFQARARRSRRTVMVVVGFCLLIVAGCLELMAAYTGDWGWVVALWGLIAGFAIFYVVRPETGDEPGR